MSDQKKPTILYDPMPKVDLKLPPLVQRPYEQSTGSLVKERPEAPQALASALSNIRL